jgi:hypothetical protein
MTESTRREHRGPDEEAPREERLEGGGYRELFRRGTFPLAPPEGTDSTGHPEMVAAVEWLTAWKEGEIGKWWPGQFRTLTVTRALPGGRTATLTCRTHPTDRAIRVTIGTDMVPGEPGYVDPARSPGLMTLCYHPGPNATVERLVRYGDAPVDWLAMRLVADLEYLVESDSGALEGEYALHEGSRLPEMEVFEGIQTGELLAILRESDYDATADPDLLDTAMVERRSWESRPRAIVVSAPTPFDIRMADGDDTGWGTAIFSAALPGTVSPEVVNNLNALLPVGCAWRRDDVVVLLRYNLRLTGGLSCAAVRNRIDDWMEGLELAERLLAQADGDRT